MQKEEKFEDNNRRSKKDRDIKRNENNSEHSNLENKDLAYEGSNSNKYAQDIFYS